MDEFCQNGRILPITIVKAFCVMSSELIERYFMSTHVGDVI